MQILNRLSKNFALKILFKGIYCMLPGPFGALFEHISINRGKVVFATLCSVLNKVCDIVPEILIGISIDVVVNQKHSLVAKTGIIDPIHQLYLVAAITAGFWIFESVFEYLYSLAWNDIAHTIQHDLRVQSYATLQSMELSYFERTTNGQLLNTLHDDINQLKQFLSQTPNEVIQLITNVVVLGGIFFVLTPMIALMALIPIPFVVGIAYHFQHKLAVLYTVVRDASANVAGWIAYRLHGIATIKSYATEVYEVAGLELESRKYLIANSQASKTQAQYIPIVRMAIMAGFIMVLLLGGIYVLQGKLPINWYAALIFMSQRFLWPFTSISTMTDMYEQSAACAQRVLAILQSRPSIQDMPCVQNHANISKGAVLFQNIMFGYTEKNPLFKGFTLEIPSKKTFAFVGTTGSGKSTIVKLLLRFYQLHAGSILIDGQDIENISLKTLRSSIGFVSQEAYMVDATIADNIRYGSFDASDADVIAAAQAAQAHTFILALPQGYNTVVKEHGKNLSGGQRQRLAIARALIKKAPILIFDEATSAVDNETEAAIGQAIADLKHNHTIIIIAHRLTTVRIADTICVLQNGEIAEMGSHDELLEKNALYARLWKNQT